VMQWGWVSGSPHFKGMHCLHLQWLEVHKIATDILLSPLRWSSSPTSHSDYVSRLFFTQSVWGLRYTTRYNKSLYLMPKVKSILSLKLLFPFCCHIIPWPPSWCNSNSNRYSISKATHFTMFGLLQTQTTKGSPTDSGDESIQGLALWHKRHFEEKNGECAGCLKYSVLIFVEKIYIKCNIWRVAVRPSYI
jgi:hypothetical protein